MRAEVERYRGEAEQYREELTRHEHNSGRVMRELNLLRERNEARG